MILEQRTVKDALCLLRSLEPASSEAFTVTGRDDSMVSIECTPHGLGLLRPENGLLVHTNHFLSRELQKYERFIAEIPDTCSRLRRLKELFSRFGDSLCVETIKAVLADHDNFPYSLCRHISHAPNSIATCVSVIAEPQKGRMYVASGTPCVKPYSLYELK